jgi:threonine dehydratase
MITLKDIEKAKTRLDGIIQYTPLAYAPVLSKQLGANIYLKKENLQITGSFKIRGAFNKLSTLNESEKSCGVVAASAGNHAQGIAYSANYFNIDATIVMPEATPLTKVSGVKSHGANVILYGASYDDAYEYALKFAKEHNKTFVHPYADDTVIAGQGTLALEILEQIDDIDIIIIPIGGGGLITGMATVIKELKPDVKIIGVVASGANAMKLSFEAKEIKTVQKVKTIADGIAVKNVMPIMYNYVSNIIDEIVQVSDNEIANAILTLMEKQKIIVEGAGATSLAAILHGKIDIKNKNVVLPLSGGNIDVSMLSLIIEKGLIKSARKMNLIITLMDKPGALKKLTKIFEEVDANIVQIDYDRDSVTLDFGEANITISLETKGENHQNKLKEKLRENGYLFKEI